jgi:hypothetical protein
MPVAIEVVYSSVQIPNYTPGTKFGATQRNGEAQRCIFPFEALKEVSPFLEAFWGYGYMSSFTLWSRRWDMIASTILLNIQKVLLWMTPYLQNQAEMQHQDYIKGGLKVKILLPLFKL